MNVHDDLLQQAAAAAILEETPTVVVVDGLAESQLALTETGQLVEGISRNVESLGAATESLESFVSGVFDAVSAENWNPRIARQYQIGMGNILATAGVNVPVSMYASSFESAEKTETNEENRTSSAAKGKEFLKKVWESVVAAVQGFIEMVVNYASQIGKNKEAIAKAAENLKARVNGLSGKPSKEKFEGTPGWARYLFKDGSLKNDPAGVLRETTSEVADACTKWFVAYNLANGLIKATIGSNKPMDGAKPAQVPLDKIAGSYYGNHVVTLSPAAPTSTSAEEWLKGMSVLTIKDGKSDKGAKGEISVMDTGEIKSVAEALAQMATRMGTIEKLVNDNVTALKGVLASVKTTAAGSGDGKASKSDIGLISKVVGRAASGVKVLLPIMGDVGKCAYSHADASIKLYGKAEKEEKPAEGEKKPEEKGTE